MGYLLGQLLENNEKLILYVFTQKDKCENLRRIILFGVEVELHVGMANELASDANKLNAIFTQKALGQKGTLLGIHFVKS